MRAGRGPMWSSLFGKRLPASETASQNCCAKWNRRANSLNSIYIAHHDGGLMASPAPLPLRWVHNPEHTSTRSSRAAGCLRGTLLMLCIWLCYVDTLWRHLVLLPRPSAGGPALSTILHGAWTHHYFSASSGWIARLLIVHHQACACFGGGTWCAVGIGRLQPQAYCDVLRQNSVWFIVPAAALSAPPTQAAGRNQGRTSIILRRRRLFGIHMFDFQANRKNRRRFDQISPEPKVCNESGGVCGNFSDRVGQTVENHASDGSTILPSRTVEGNRRPHVALSDLIGTEMIDGHKFEERRSTEHTLPSSPPAADKRHHPWGCKGENLCCTPTAEVGAAKRKLTSVISSKDGQIKRRAPEGKPTEVGQRESQAELATVRSVTHRGTTAAKIVGNVAADHTASEAIHVKQLETGNDRRHVESEAQIHQQTGPTLARSSATEQDSMLTSGSLSSNSIIPSQRLSRHSQDAPELLPIVEDSNSLSFSGTAEVFQQPAYQPPGEMGLSANFLSGTGTHADDEQVQVTEGATKQHGNVVESDGEQKFSEKLWEWTRTAGAGDSVIDHASAALESPKRSARSLGRDPKAAIQQLERQEGRELGSHTLSSENRSYRAEDIPKTYGDSFNSSVAELTRGRTREAGASSNVQHGEEWFPQEEKSKPGAAQDQAQRRESFAEAEMFDEVDWTDPESVARVESILSHQVRALERQASTLEDQLKGIQADMQVYRAGIEGVNPKQNADTFEQLVHGGQSSSQQMLLEKLQTASESLDSRVKNYVRTNTTFYANQLNDIVQVRLAPLRQGVLDLSMSLMDAASSTIDITRKLNEAASHVNVTTTREAVQMQGLRARREAAFSEALEEEEVAMQAHLVASKQREQSRVNKSSVEEQILLSAVEGAVDDLRKRGFAVLDFSAVYPESEARKVLDLTLHFTDLQTRPHGWEVLPIVVVPSSGFVGHVDIPRTASEWLTGVLAATYGKLPSAPADTTTALQRDEKGTRAVHKEKRARDTRYSRILKRDKPAFTSDDKSRQAANETTEDYITTAGSADLVHATPKNGDRRIATDQQDRLDTTYKKGSRTRSVFFPGLQDWRSLRRSSIIQRNGSTFDPLQVETSHHSAAATTRGHILQGQPSTGNTAVAPGGQLATVSGVDAVAEKFGGAARRDIAYSHGLHYGTAGLHRLGSEAAAEKDFSGAQFSVEQVSAAEGAGSDTSNNGRVLGRCESSSQRQMEPRRLSLLEDAWRGRCTRAFKQDKIRRLLRSKNIGLQTQVRNPQSEKIQFFSAPQLILGESHPDEDQAEAGRKWQAVVLRKTRAVVASCWGKAGHLPGETFESRWARSILPPTYTLQHLVREHFKNLPAEPEGSHLLWSDKGSHISGEESSHSDKGRAAVHGSVNAYTSDNTTGASGVTSSRPTIAHDQKKQNLGQIPVFGNRIGYYVLRAEQILLEGFYVAPGGEVSSVLLRYPHLRDLGPLVHSSEYGVQLLRQLATSLHTKPELQKRSSLKCSAQSTSQLAGGDKGEGNNDSTDQPASGIDHAQARTVQTNSAFKAQHEKEVKSEEGGNSEGVLKCTPANYNPFLRCLTSRRLPGIVRSDPSSAIGTRSTEGYVGPSQRLKVPSKTLHDISPPGVPARSADILREGTHHLQKQTGPKKSAGSKTVNEEHLKPVGNSKMGEFKKMSSHPERVGRGVFMPGTTGVPDKHSSAFQAAFPRSERSTMPTNDGAWRKGDKIPPLTSATAPVLSGNSGDSAEVQSSVTHTSMRTSRTGSTLTDTERADEKVRRNRKVLIIHLGPRSDGLPLAYSDGAGGKELQRQRLVRRSLTELLASSGDTEVPTEDCGSCPACLVDNSTCAPQLPKPQNMKGATTPPVPGDCGTSPKRPEMSTRDGQIWNTHRDADPQRPSNDQQWPRRFGQLDAVGAGNGNAVTLAKTLRDVKLESAVRRQLLALEQELRLASPTRWALNGALIEKHLENHQVEISVAWGPPPPPLHLPLTPFFMRNILLIRVEVEKCPKKYGAHSYGVPPSSVLEQALYLLAHPVAGHAAVAAFHYGRTSEASLLERLRKAHQHLDVTASDIAMHAASFWGRATGASTQTFWIAHVHVKAPGQSNGSTIELLDGRLTAEPGSFVPLSGSAEQRVHFPSEVKAWGWRYAEPLKPDEGPFLKGRTASYGEGASDCKPVEALVGSTAANLQTRIIPHTFVSGLRGRSVIVALSGTDTPFKGEQLISQADLEAEWRAETSRQKKQ